jgi:hypothetical protein
MARLSYCRQSNLSISALGSLTDTAFAKFERELYNLWRMEDEQDYE